MRKFSSKYPADGLSALIKIVIMSAFVILFIALYIFLIYELGDFLNSGTMFEDNRSRD